MSSPRTGASTSSPRREDEIPQPVRLDPIGRCTGYSVLYAVGRRNGWRAWIIEVGEPLPIDVGRPRLMRAGLLTEELTPPRPRRRVVHLGVRPSRRSRCVQRGHTSSRSATASTNSDSSMHSVTAATSHRDESSITWSNARSFRKLANAWPLPDVICVGLPTLELAGAATRVRADARHPGVCRRP